MKRSTHFRFNITDAPLHPAARCARVWQANIPRKKQAVRWATGKPRNPPSHLIVKLAGAAERWAWATNTYVTPKKKKEPTMSKASVLRQKAEMFERRAETAADPLSKRHYREMAAHYRQLLVEHLDTRKHTHETAE